jgi:MFS family permease
MLSLLAFVSLLLDLELPQDMMAVSMLIPLLARLYTSLDASASDIGLMGSAYGVTNLIGGPFFGYLSDAIGARQSLLIAMLGSAVGYAMVASATSLPMMAAGRMVTGLFKQTLTIGKSALAVITPPHERAHAMGRFSSAASAGFIVGPLLGGFMFPEGDDAVRYMAMLTSSVFVLSGLVAWVGLKGVAERDANHKQADDAPGE